MPVLLARGRAAWVAAITVASAVSLTMCITACSSAPTVQFQTEDFDSSTTYSRVVPASQAKTCEAARRALLSQGYVVSLVNTDTVNARKSFQPSSDSHIEIEFRVVCTLEAKGSGNTLTFVSALQDRYGLKKSNNSASVGVGAFGSLSLPFISSDDSLVKVASETITAASFYDRFFKLLTRYLSNEVDEPTPALTLVPVATPAPGPGQGAALGPQPAASAASSPAPLPSPAASAPAAESPAASEPAASAPPAAAPASAP